MYFIPLCEVRIVTSYCGVLSNYLCRELFLSHKIVMGHKPTFYGGSAGVVPEDLSPISNGTTARPGALLMEHPAHWLLDKDQHG